MTVILLDDTVPEPVPDSAPTTPCAGVRFWRPGATAPAPGARQPW